MKSASWLETTLVTVCLVAVVFPIANTHGDTIVHMWRLPLDTDVFPVRENSLSAEDALSVQVEDGSTQIEGEHPDLLTACPDPADERLSEACLLALDRFYLNKAYGYQSAYYPIHYQDGSDGNLYYRRIFADPEGDRIHVFAVLDQEKCFLTGDDRLEYWGHSGRNLKESCHAEAFTNHAQFGAICSAYRDGRDAEREWIDPKWSVYGAKTRFQHFVSVLEEFRNRSDNDVEYERRKEWLWEEVLEARWLKRQCAKSDSVPTIDGDRFVKEYERLKTLSTRLEHVHVSIWESQHPRTNIFEGLTRLASFLGERATRQGYRLEADSWQELVYGVRVGEGKGTGMLDKGSLASTNARGTRVYTGVSAVLALENHGIDFDWHWLIESICRTSDYRGPDEEGNKSCRWWVDNFRTGLLDGVSEFLRDREDAETYSRSQESLLEYLRVYDRFEEVALELGIYD